MRRVGVLLVTAVLAGPAYGQSPGQSPGKPPAPQTTNAVACGSLKGESLRKDATFQWTVSGPSGKTTETGILKSGPRFECLDGAILTLEFASTAGHGVFEAYFPDGSTISYGRQQIDRRGNRFVLPIQAKARIAAPWRAAFDYHCRLDMPADPIPASARADCIF
jgi:hypothetical protein